jgi:hypothetical protein
VPKTIALSESAVALPRYRGKKWPIKVKESQLLGYQELVDPGIMAPDGNDFRFTEDGYANREELLRDAEDRIERERFEPPDASNLSEAARDLLRRRLAGDREVTDANRPLYRELVAARIMIPIHSFIGGPESAFHFTYWGWEVRLEFAEFPIRSSAERRDNPLGRHTARRNRERALPGHATSAWLREACRSWLAAGTEPRDAGPQFS